MSYRKVSGLAAAMGMALALAGSAYADQGKSPNGAPGPEGNPNPPAAQPQANGPQGPAGNESQGQRSQSHGKSQAPSKSKGKSNSSHGKSQSAPNNSKSQSKSNHANPNPGTPRKGGREDRPSPKITICHATRSETNPYVEITISENGLNGHGPAADPHHHEGSWKDIIPAPAGGCPTTVQSGTTTQEQGTSNNTTTNTTTTNTTTTTQTAPVEVRPDLGVIAPAAPADGQAVLGVQAEGGSSPEAAETAPAGNKVLGASAEGGEAPAEALAAREADEDEKGSLPFTGLELIVVLAAAAAALLAGFALRRVLGTTQS